MTEENRQNAIAFVRSEIATLSEQTDNHERLAYHNRAHGALFAIHAGGLITAEEVLALGNEIGVANTKASSQVRGAKR
ncbi:hypothetical protein FRT60_06855 [Pseudomonas haemolytica]|uniref:Uncharacterized protein n=1 Tax=Pseudomonas haemolytica TaxID=2600065 RepID=A0A646NTL0_9PSED|nr:hypothetical protein [Pseudomonas haemolytica]MRJ20057.1 hypothetical protein [Pseudomonas haemolytica]